MCLFIFCSALHIAAKSGLTRVVKELIQRGTDLYARDSDGNSCTCSSSIHFLSIDYTPALCCAPNPAVANCLELVLQAMLEQKVPLSSDSGQ